MQMNVPSKAETDSTNKENKPVVISEDRESGSGNIVVWK